ncbi:metallophosphoesterase [Porphyromonadaceae bacterium OttesenSCG-928-L07]|nr:metallophosphoesterase [Porphyromonadaceae bacterium OttesenSCG-928-L07]MDL2252104.1 metallophosphoesterase [Odoribacter sp. OttesenSCG-928-J03]MDL2330962.1 metallophosphoesterase [Odoribacter sp. OttesenSCG-928-A06]
MKPGILIGMLLLYTVSNIYVFSRIWQVVPTHHTLAKVLFIFFAIVLACSMFASFIWGNLLPLQVLSVLYKIGTAWLMILLYLFMFIALRDLILLSDRWWHFIPASLGNMQGFQRMSLLIALGIGFLFLLGGNIRYWNKKRVELTIETEKALPKEEIKIIAISDMHLGYGIGNGELKKWIKQINSEQADIVLIAGDIIDNSVRPLEAWHTDEILQQIKAPMGVYACPGNHEYISDMKRSEEFIKKSGICLLQDSALLIHDAFYIIGRDDRMNPERKSTQELVQNLDKSKPLILLDHQPYMLEESVENGIDLQLSGHTHRGQVWPISIITDRLFEVSHGYLKKEHTHIYVSSGLGIWGGKFRIGTQSEYVVINVRHIH